MTQLWVAVCKGKTSHSLEMPPSSLLETKLTWGDVVWFLHFPPLQAPTLTHTLEPAVTKTHTLRNDCFQFPRLWHNWPSPAVTPHQALCSRTTLLSPKQAAFPFLGLPSYPVQILWSTLSHSLENVGSLPMCLLLWYLLRTSALPAPKPLPIVGKVKPGRWGPPETHVWALCCTHSWGSTPGKRSRLSAQSPPTTRPGLSQALRTWSLDGLVC